MAKITSVTIFSNNKLEFLYFPSKLKAQVLVLLFLATLNFAVYTGSCMPPLSPWCKFPPETVQLLSTPMFKIYFSKLNSRARPHPLIPAASEAEVPTNLLARNYEHMYII